MCECGALLPIPRAGSRILPKVLKVATTLCMGVLGGIIGNNLTAPSNTFVGGIFHSLGERFSGASVFAILDEADAGFAANRKQVAKWLAEHPTPPGQPTGPGG